MIVPSTVIVDIVTVADVVGVLVEDADAAAEAVVVMVAVVIGVVVAGVIVVVVVVVVCAGAIYVVDAMIMVEPVIVDD